MNGSTKEGGFEAFVATGVGSVVSPEVASEIVANVSGCAPRSFEDVAEGRGVFLRKMIIASEAAAPMEVAGWTDLRDALRRTFSENGVETQNGPLEEGSQRRMETSDEAQATKLIDPANRDESNAGDAADHRKSTGAPVQERILLLLSSSTNGLLLRREVRSD